ncbi:hypothetical protein AT267_19315 [Bacillus cereus]|nr:hypothetical protein AT267_19315 [Bacillus cereus]
MLAAGTGYYLKAEAARPEWEEDGASDVEALFASQEDAKPLTILAAEAGYYLKVTTEPDSFHHLNIKIPC